MAYHNAVGKYRPDIYCNTHNGGEYMMTFSDTQLEKRIKSLKAQYETDYNVTNRYPIYHGGSGGMIMADAYGLWGASGWLWELTTWDTLKPTLDEWLAVCYPRALPVFLAFAKAVEREPISNTTDTFNIYDAIALANAFYSTQDMPNWKPRFDLNSDGFIDINDAIILARTFVP
jgi:hypothetical protein